MRITRKQLRRIIKEERARLREVGPPPDMDAPGFHPNDMQEWEREARSEERGERDKGKNTFLANEQARWEDEFAVDTDDEAKLVTDILSKAYDEMYYEMFGDY